MKSKEEKIALLLSKMSPESRQKTEQSLLASKIHSLNEDTYCAEVTIASNVQPKKQPWFWDRIIPLNTSTLYAGFGNSGKSQLLIFQAAKASTGEEFKAGGKVCQYPQGGVIILSGEDDEEYQLVPRLIAAKADLSKIYILKMMKVPGKPLALLDLDAHLVLLENTINNARNEGNPIKLIIVDPVQYFTGELKDFSTCVCRFIASLNSLAKQNNIALIMNKHLRKKGTSEGISSAVDSVSGSGAWTTSPRSCWLIQRHPTKQGVILFADLKGNLKAKDTKSLAYRIDSVMINDPSNEGKQIETTALTWLDELEPFNADEALSVAAMPPIEQAIRQWIINFLLECNKNMNNGAMFLSSELYNEALSAGHARESYYRVKKKMFDEGIIKEVVEGKGKKVLMVALSDPESYK